MKKIIIAAGILLVENVFAGQCTITNGVRSTGVTYQQIGIHNIYLKDVLIQSSLTSDKDSSMFECFDEALHRAEEIPDSYRAPSYVKWDYGILSGKVDAKTKRFDDRDLGDLLGDRRGFIEGKNIFPCAVYFVDDDKNPTETRLESNGFSMPDPGGGSSDEEPGLWEHLVYHLKPVTGENSKNQTSATAAFDQCRIFAQEILNSADAISSTTQAIFQIDDSVFANRNGIVHRTKK